jgi:hypothetical protein
MKTTTDNTVDIYTQTGRRAYGGGYRKGRRQTEARQSSIFSIHAGKQSPDEQMTKLHVQQAYPPEFRETVEIR